MAFRSPFDEPSGNPRQYPKCGNLSNKTVRWLVEWAWVTKKFNPYVEIPGDIIKELSPYKPNKTVVLFRAVTYPEDEKRRLYRSFTYEYDMADNILLGYEDDKNYKNMYILVILAKPKDIIVDFTKLPCPDEFINEVIIKKSDDILELKRIPVDVINSWGE